MQLSKVSPLACVVFVTASGALVIVVVVIALVAVAAEQGERQSGSAN